jgi:adenylosuccinate synthase
MNTVVIGAQWGDEGKGKIVDYLAEEADVIVRFSGGANAGHTIVSGGRQYALHLIPSGALYPGKTVVLGTGMVIDPKALFAEIALLEEQGIDTKGRLFISDRAHIVLPSYIEIDKERDAKRKKPIGTTGRGIGITYSMKSDRDGIRVADLGWKDKLAELGTSDYDFIMGYSGRLAAMAIDMAAFMERHKEKRVLLEGAQGALLDLDLGTYPFVSSGMSSAAGAAIGAGIGPRSLHTVLGVFKAYSTRVGNGPFPTEFGGANEAEGDLGAFIREAGREYGVTTGRPRRCGYLDLVALRYACRVNSIDRLVMTHLDVYDTLGEIKAAVAYTVDGEETADFPASIEKLAAARPMLKCFKGWKRPISDVCRYDDLPEEARAYIAFIEDYCGTKVGVVSVGYERAQTMVREAVWD